MPTHRGDERIHTRHQFAGRALGKITPLDPTNFKVVANTLLLFHKTEDSDGLELWNESDITDQELIDRANKKYSIFKFNH